MRIAVFGAGAIGCLVGATLQRAGAKVSLIARGSHLAALTQSGLTVRSDGSESSYAMLASDNPEILGPQDAVVVATKAPALPDVARNIGPLLNEDTSVCFLMNGIPWWYWHHHGGSMAGRSISLLDPDDRLRVSVGVDRVIGGVVRCSARIAAPGIVEVTSPSRHIYIGEPDGRPHQRSAILCELLRRGGIDADVPSDIRDAVWEKLIGNLMDGPLAVLTMARSCTLFRNAACREIARRIGIEALDIATALGRNINLDVDRIIETGTTRAHLPSIAEDLQRGRPMEIDSYLSVPLSWAKEFGVLTPTLSSIAELVRLRASVPTDVPIP